ncbi:MAG: phenylalanine--tRNA ligase subunit beta, partial [Chloroflexi bacterium]|nr:phenylalanine--tRNA ligase subunit beta [Chloroflexota bacterium]
TSENEYLRTSLVPSLLATLASNRRHEDGPIRFFEIAHVYLPQEKDLPEEREMIGGVVSGPRSPLSWVGNNGEMDFYDAKGVVEEVLARLNLSPRFEPAELSWSAPGKGAQVLVGERKAGFVGEVHPVILDRFDIAPGPIAVLELDLESLLQAVVPIEGRRIQPLPRFPGAWRDLAVVLDQGVPAARVRELIQGHRLVAEVTLFDAYTGEQVPSGKRSLAYRVLFQSPQRTLTSQEVSQALEQIWQILRHEVGAIPRT